jgi:quercetin dioxygenase-like cupin family protein
MYRTIKLNATSETITFVKNTEDTGGKFIEFIVTLNAGSKGPGPHTHPFQVETFEMIEGVAGVLKGKEKQTLAAGQKTEIPAGMVHDFWCAENQNIKFKSVITPALNFEWMLREMFASCNRNNSSDPSLFDGAYVIHKLKGEYILGDVPRFIQKNIFPIIAALGKLTGKVKVKMLSQLVKNHSEKI